MNLKYMGGRLLAGLLAGLLVAFMSASAIAQQPRQTPQPGDVPVPDKVFGWYENQRIFVETEIPNTNMQPGDFPESAGGTYRHGERFGNRIGNLVPVRFRIYLVRPAAGQNEIQVEFAGLKSQPARLTIQPIENQDWWVANREVLAKGEPGLTIREFPDARLEWGGKVYECTRMIQVDLTVQTFKDPRYRMNLWLEFTYAAAALPGGGLDWKPLETPDFWVDMSTTADPGNVFSLGNTNPVAQQRPAALALALIGGGLFIGLTVLAFWTTRYLRRNFGGGTTMDDQERLWHTLTPILRQRAVTVEGASEAYAFTRDDLFAIIGALHQFINATEENMVDVSAWTLQELQERRLHIKDGDRWMHVLEPLRGLVQEGDVKQPEPDRYGRIVAMIRDICPQP